MCYNMEKDGNIGRLRSGEWVNGFAGAFGEYLAECGEKCFTLNSLRPSDREGRCAVLRSLFGSMGDNVIVNSPFHCDFGFNIHVGDNFIGNFNLKVLDEAEVRIGNNVFIGPNVSLCTVIHSCDPEERNSGLMCARPIVIGDNVWIASNVVVLPGVSIGEGAVIGAGSVVTKDVESFTLSYGNPCRCVRKITAADKVAEGLL